MHAIGILFSQAILMMRWILTLVFVSISSLSALSAPPLPNVIVILSDDQGWGDLSLHGNTQLQTPSLDGLAKAGARFEWFYVQPVCSPTRAEFLTGRYHPRGGVRGVTTGGERLNLDETTIAESFAKAGYATGCFGKWHNGTQYPYHPNGRGFQEFYGFTSGHWGTYFNAPLDHNGQAVRSKGYLADDLTTHAIDYIQANRAKPFFCYLAFNTPHSPMQVPDADWERFHTKELTLTGTLAKSEKPDHTRAALAMCENLDRNVGRLLKSLDDSNLAKDTIVVYFADNGPNGHRFNGTMKGIKGSTDEGGVRSPLLIRWPGTIQPNSKIDAIAGAIDLLPTILELTGVANIGTKPLDGRSFAGALRGRELPKVDRILIQHWNNRVSARDQIHRLDADGKLFNLKTDPGQLKNIATEFPELTTKLKTAVQEWRTNVLASAKGKDDRPFPVGHMAFPITQLPARDGVPHGSIKRSAGAPNCSYFTNWTKSSDSLTWDVELLSSGKYQVDVLYACVPTNLGVMIELELGGVKLANTVRDANNPPATGAENDRVPRVGESLVKEFKPWNLGTKEFPKGRNTLKLTSTGIQGGSSIEVRGLILTLTK